MLLYETLARGTGWTFDTHSAGRIGLSIWLLGEDYSGRIGLLLLPAHLLYPLRRQKLR